MDKVPWFLVGAKRKHLAVLDEDTPFDGTKGYAYWLWRSLATRSKSSRLVEVWMGSSSCGAKRRILRKKLVTGFFSERVCILEESGQQAGRRRVAVRDSGRWVHPAVAAVPLGETPHAALPSQMQPCTNAVGAAFRWAVSVPVGETLHMALPMCARWGVGHTLKKQPSSESLIPRHKRECRGSGLQQLSVGALTPQCSVGFGVVG